MRTAVIVVIVVLVVIAVVVVAALLVRRRRKEHQLREQFGPEYDRALEAHGDRHRAESDLADRRERYQHLDIRALDPGERDRFSARWRDAQARFVDEPKAAVGEADLLVAEVMRARGYPLEDFEQRARDVSVEHPGVVEHYRAAHRISLANERGEAKTEDLRQAMVHYRELFDDLLDRHNGT